MEKYLNDWYTTKCLSDSLKTIYFLITNQGLNVDIHILTSGYLSHMRFINLLVRAMKPEMYFLTYRNPLIRFGSKVSLSSNIFASCCWKLFERILYNKMYEFFTENNLISSRYTFRHFRSICLDMAPGALAQVKTKWYFRKTVWYHDRFFKFQKIKGCLNWTMFFMD